jgi:hypothetical protein
MALQTDIIVLGSKFEAMGFVAIAAGHTRMEHSALDERTVLINFALDLAVWEIEVLIEQRNAIVVIHGLAKHVVLVNLATARMASRTHLNFPFRLAGPAASNFVAGRLKWPGHSFAFVKRNSRSLINVEFSPFALPASP